MRVWIAIWMLLISLVVVALEGSVLVRKFTRFTTEIFSSLVSILFIFESLSKLATVRLYPTGHSIYIQTGYSVPMSKRATVCCLQTGHSMLSPNGS